jgi:HK97 gp10 family phage protein
MPKLIIETKFNHFDRMISNFKPQVWRIMQKLGNEAFADSQMAVPVRRDQRKVRGGALKNSGTMDMNYGSLSVEIRYTMYYAGYVHDGTYKMPARPFLREPIEAKGRELTQAFSVLESRLF